MRFRWFGALGTGLCCLSLLASGASLRAAPKEAGPEKVLDAYALATRIDAHIKVKWDQNKVTPTRPADDAEFLRRISLDLIGRIPTVTELHDFLDGPSPDKRRKVIEEMLGLRPSVKYAVHGYVGHFTVVWRDLLVPQGLGNNQFAPQFAQQMESWLTKRILDNAGYDTLVRDLLTAEPYGNRGSGRQPGPVNPADRSAIAFYQANENKPENVAATVSRLFLGVKLECAQCHDHPFNRYSRSQFWELAAFFSGLTPQGARPRQPGAFQGFDPTRKQIKIVGTERVVEAKFLDGKAPKFEEGADVRTVLADWIVAPENPYFSKAAVNYVWAQFFGVGITDPVDEPSDDNPPSHPELLDELARQFALNKYDLKYLIKAITASRAYQLSSVLTHPTQQDARLFAVVQLKGMAPEQLLRSLNLAVGNLEGASRFPQGFRGRPGFNTMAFELRNKFANYSDKKTAYQTSILQALALMNGKLTADATSLTRSGTLAAVANSHFLDTEGKLNALFLATLSRKMKPNEAARLVRYVDGGGPSKDNDKALADVFWTLLNSSEFILNH
jgi:hypothetical protein